MSGKFFCEVSIYMNSGELAFQHACGTKKAAEELADRIHRQYAESASAEVLTLKLPCRKNQAPRTVSLRTKDVCAIDTLVGQWDGAGADEGFKIELGFHVTEANDPAPTEIESDSNRELAARKTG